ncbi:MAG TPA: PIN domain-containing protein [Conexibacter sp.]|nr:PIN domain-containing protein [Conexibacter sp.]
MTNSTSRFPSSFVIADTSARLRIDRSPVAAAQWKLAKETSAIGTCAVVTLELFNSARNAHGVALFDAEERTLRTVSITRSMQEAAVCAARELSRRGAGYHRVPPADALIAAAAQEVGADVLHYDHHFDRLAEVLHFRSLWLAPAGSLS